MYDIIIVVFKVQVSAVPVSPVDSGGREVVNVIRN